MKPAPHRSCPSPATPAPGDAAARREGFWKAAEGAGLVILTDFDDTITTADVGTLIWEQLTPPSEETLGQISSGEIGSRLAYLETTAWVDPSAAQALADTVSIDPDFAAFAAWCRQSRIPLAVVSDGFTFYIDRILGREGLSDLPVFANRWVAPGEIAFDHANPACDWCGCCKAAVARRLRAAGSRVIYLGDGESDLYAAGFADWLFARGRLARYLTEQGTPFFPLDSFGTASRIIGENLERFRDGSMAQRSARSPHPNCRFAD